MKHERVSAQEAAELKGKLAEMRRLKFWNTLAVTRDWCLEIEASIETGNAITRRTANLIEVAYADNETGGSLSAPKIKKRKNQKRPKIARGKNRSDVREAIEMLDAMIASCVELAWARGVRGCLKSGKVKQRTLDRVRKVYDEHKAQIVRRPGVVRHAQFYARRNQTLRDLGYKNYDEYLKSRRWERIRRRCLLRDARKCCCCKRTATQVHHLDYERPTLDGEAMHRLVSICASCHETIEHDILGNKIQDPEEIESRRQRLMTGNQP